MTQGIPIGNGLVALIDDADHEWLSTFRWHAQKARRVFYVARREVYFRADGSRATRARQMQQDLLYPGRKCPKGVKADHINRNPLDNRRCNLRLVSNSVNTLNEDLRRSNTTGYRGVYYDRPHGYYAVGVTALGRRVNGGGFVSAEDAARAYNSLARLHHGEHAQFNDVPGGGPQFFDEAIAGLLATKRAAKRRARRAANERQAGLLD